MKDVLGKTAFVTGGASGMGFAMARSFARAGMKVAIADVEAPALERAARELGAITPEVLAVRADVSRSEDVEAAAAATEARFGKVHVLCNNAGVSVAGSIERMQPSDWSWVMGVNLQGVIHGLQAFLPRILSHGEGGHVVNTASISGLFAQPSVGIYVCSKFAVVGLSESMRPDLARKNVGVSVLCPEAVNTGIVTSSRNRPEHLRRQPSGGRREAQDPAIAEAIRKVFANALDPAVIGDMVLEAIRNDDLYILSHPAQRAAVQARHDAILAAFDRWERYRERVGV